MTFQGGTSNYGVIFKYGLTTGITENKKTNNEISIFPNPFSSQAVLQTANIFNDATLIVYNLYGQLVKQITNTSGQTITFSRDNLPIGLYFVHLIQDNQVIGTEKIIITD